MKKLHFDITIAAPRETVWDSLTTDAPYRIWAAVFMPGSYFEGSWDKGARIRFLAGGPNGEVEGMFSEIAESRRPEFISIRHLGVVRNGKEDRDSKEAKMWVPGYENYTLTDVGGKTKLDVDLDGLDDSLAEMFANQWPKALELLKKTSEEQGR